MKTIDPLELEARITGGDRVELIDVCAREDFRKIHALGAHSIPLAEFRARKVLRERILPASEPLYVMCRDKVLAELAVESLQGDGCENAIIVKGGMKAWRRSGLPVVRRAPWHIPPIGSRTVAVIAGLAVGLGLVVHDFFFLLAVLVVVWWAVPSIFRFGRACFEDLNLAASQPKYRHS